MLIFTAGGGRVDRGDLLALDERVRIVERSQTPASRRSRTPGAGRIEEVSTESDISDQDFDLPTPGSRKKRRERRLSGRGSPRRARTPTSSETEREQFRRSMTAAVVGGQAAPQPEPEPEPAAEQVITSPRRRAAERAIRKRGAPRIQRGRSEELAGAVDIASLAITGERLPEGVRHQVVQEARGDERALHAIGRSARPEDIAARTGVSPQEERRREFLETGTSGGGSVEREQRSPSVEISTQTEPAQTARRIVSARRLTPAEQDARARAIAEQAQVEIREAEAVLAEDEPEVPLPRIPSRSPKSVIQATGFREASASPTPRSKFFHTRREQQAEERFYQRQPSPGTPSPERDPDPEAVVVERAVERLESPGIVSDALGAVARGTLGVAQGAAEGVVSALPSAEDVGKAVGRGVVGVAVQGFKGAKAVAEVASEAVIGAVSPEPEPAIGQQTGAPLVPRKSGEEQLFQEVSPYEQLLALRQPKNQFLFKESKRGTKKSDHPINLGTETYERKFRLTDHGGKIGDAEPGRPYLVYSMGGSGTQRKDQIGFVEEAHDEEFEEGERIFGNIKESKLRKLLDSEELELDLSD